MGVQTFATSRNGQVELFVEFILESYFKPLVNENIISQLIIESQKEYKSDISSDVWDHFVSFHDIILKQDVELWCQTTSYKGNKSGKPEPNKTYEIRETLVEAISIRERIDTVKKIVRTIHFTVGPKKYAYDWFVGAKDKTFDLSLYLDLEKDDIFDLLEKIIGKAKTDLQIKNNIADSTKTELIFKRLINSTKANLKDWHLNRKLPIQEYASLQYQLIKNELKTRSSEISKAIKLSKGAGIDVKKRCNDVINEKVENDPYIIKTTEKLLDTNPFIRSVKKILADWSSYSIFIDSILKSSDSLKSFITHLWNIENIDKRLPLRRALMRLKSEEIINYIQDIDVSGVTEHNLYKGNHNSQQVSEIVAIIASKLLAQKIKTKEELATELKSTKTKAILKSSLWFEAKNGTTLKPSFDYIVNVLEDRNFKVVNASALPNKSIGYHAQLMTAGEKVSSYTNLKIIQDLNGNTLAYLKGKYFRPQELPRRCKEESYVALTLKYRLTGIKFSLTHKYPIIMFIDMPSNFNPPEFALRQIQCFGWSICFNADQIENLISK